MVYGKYLRAFVIGIVLVSFSVADVVSNHCVDILPNCKAYGDGACHGDYRPWAETNCASTCGLCDSNTCKDKLDNCESYGPAACHDQYIIWAKQNCELTCRLCDVGLTGV
ncbi:nematocyst expressed protein 3-like isoform X2 [Haliotis rufescens]|uniref:nematocyst expressed protein 3-like isoform X2 n=1 Tax=Haliotis rufescens TaxID=6454 RepID=UPI00201EDBB3|nr:nematocyst expressed protein 3-like isoform X2 [Haliotis rufescens]